jgi:MFS family permease
MIASRVTSLLDDAPLTPLHRRVWLLSSMGIMLDGFDFFIMGVAIPLISHEWNPSSAELGLISSSAIIGAIVGAFAIGSLTDKIGRQLAFRIDLGMFVVFAVLSALSPSIAWLIAFRFFLGVGIGADYPISSSYVAEIAPARDRSRLLVGAFSFQAVGQLLGVLVGLVILQVYPDAGSWRYMLAAGVVPAVFILWLRRGVPESPKWLASSGNLDEAAQVVSIFCRHPVTVQDLQEDTVAPGTAAGGVSWRDLFSAPMRKATTLSAVPWFLMDIATYGVGVFTPTIIGAIAISGGASKTRYIADDIASTKGAAFVDLFLVVGFLIALLLIVHVGKIRLQVTGFIAMTVGLLILAYASHLSGGGDENLLLVFLGFSTFNLFMNAGPNPTTYVMPAEVYETRVRCTGSGFAAAAGKTGAAVGTLFFPTLQSTFGLSWTLIFIGMACAIAATVTFALREVAERPAPA